MLLFFYSIVKILLYIGSPGEIIFTPIMSYCKKKNIQLPNIVIKLISFLRRFTCIYGWVPTYKNYGGPAYSSGDFTKWGYYTDWTVKPVDDLDSLYYDHDNSYQVAIAKHDSEISIAKLTCALYEENSEKLENSIKEEDQKRLIAIYNADKNLVSGLLNLYLSKPESWENTPMVYNNMTTIGYILNIISKYYAIIYGHCSLGIFWVKMKIEYLMVKEYL